MHFFPFGLFMVYIPECKHQLINYEIIHVEYEILHTLYLCLMNPIFNHTNVKLAVCLLTAETFHYVFKCQYRLYIYQIKIQKTTFAKCFHLRVYI
jgi:hypothetical protein